MKSGFLDALKKSDNSLFLFWSTLFFYIFLLVLNPQNKIIIAGFVPLFVVFYLKIKSFHISLFLIYLSSIVIQIGKTYPIQLIAPGFFPTEIFPLGYFVKLVVTPTHIIAFFLLSVIIRNIFTKEYKIRINLTDTLLIIFYFLKFLSAIIASKEPGISLAFEVLSIEPLIAYFFARTFIAGKKGVLKNTAYILCAMILLEVVLGILQLINKSPLYKNIEYQINIEYFGHAIDEAQFTFRPVGTFDHANSLGIWLASVLLFLTSFITEGFTKFKKIYALSFVGGLILLTTTLSRSAWLGFVGGIMLFIKSGFLYLESFYKSFVRAVSEWKYVILLLFIFSLVFFILPRAQNSLYSFQRDAGGLFFRKIQILDAIEIIKMHPFFGIGASMSAYEGIYLDLYTVAASIPLQIHNWYLQIALENGLLAFFAITFFFLLSLRNLANNQTQINLSIFAAVLSALIAGLLQPYINFSFIVLLLSLTNGANIKPLK